MKLKLTPKSLSDFAIAETSLLPADCERSTKVAGVGREFFASLPMTQNEQVHLRGTEFVRIIINIFCNVSSYHSRSKSSGNNQLAVTESENLGSGE